MTEEEKKKAVEAAKERVTKHAVGAAVVATALAPNLANAQTAEQAANISPTPIEQTVAAAPSSNIVMSEQEAANAPAFGSKEWLRSNLKEDCAEHEAALATRTEALREASATSTAETSNYAEYEQNLADRNNQSLAAYHNESQDIAYKLARPCTEDSKPFRIGNWNTTHAVSLFSQSTSQANNTPSETPARPKKPSDYIDHSTIKHKAYEESEGFLAFYKTETGEIYLNEYSDSKKKYANLEIEVMGSNYENEFIAGNPVSRNNILFHEVNHKIDYEYNEQSKLHETPLNAARADRLTETKSCAVEYLAAAQQYTVAKKAGIKTLQINGKEKPIESILEIYPGLKETIDKHGFDASDPKSVRNVVEKASQFWHQNQQSGYVKQDITYASNASKNFKNKTISEQLELLKNEDKTYADVSEKMLKNTYIGQNTVVDLSGCRDLLDTLDKKEFAQTIQNYQSSDFSQSNQAINSINLVSYDELNTINTHLEKKGYHTDEEKSRYLNRAIQNISTREKYQDKELKDIMLSYNPTMTYADGLSETASKDMRIVNDKEGNSYLITDQMLADAKNMEDRKKISPMIGDTLTPLNLSPIDTSDIHKEVKQQRQDHDAELTHRINELTAPTPEKTQEAKQKAPADLSQTLINQKIQSTAR